MNKKDRPYTLEIYNPKWKDLFENERSILANIFGADILIEHIGSTSIEGMWAKPQIDILVLVTNLSDVEALIPSLTKEGYNFREEFNKHNERYFTRDSKSGERLVSVHVMTKENPEATTHLYFRDYLRSHSEARDLYSQAKFEAYDHGKTDRVAYSKRKKDVLLKILDKARNWHNEPVAE